MYAFMDSASFTFVNNLNGVCACVCVVGSISHQICYLNLT